MPPLYKVSGIKLAVYTKNQLQVVPNDETAPNAKQYIRGEPKQFIIEKILKKKKMYGKIVKVIHYLIIFKYILNINDIK